MPGKMILLVEDSAMDVLLIKRALEKSTITHELVVAHDGVEAIDYLFGTGQFAARETNNLPKVVFLDLKLPRMDGLEVLRRIRADERTKLLPVVILTSSSEKHDIEESYRLGTNDYVQKPVDFKQFAEVVKQLAQTWLV